MRVWDLHPGYLNRASLLGEHREVHALYSILDQNKAGYRRHPETLRFEGRLGGLVWRHRWLVSEMKLRGYNHQSPLKPQSGDYPKTFVDSPAEQIKRLAEKYRDKKPGRIQLPHNAQELWAQHKYAVMARSQTAYKAWGPQLASGGFSFEELALRLVQLLRSAATEGGLVNAYAHMLGYFSEATKALCPHPKTESAQTLRNCLIERLKIEPTSYLWASTILAEPGF